MKQLPDMQDETVVDLGAVEATDEGDLAKKINDKMKNMIPGME